MNSRDTVPNDPGTRKSSLKSSIIKALRTSSSSESAVSRNTVAQTHHATNLLQDEQVKRVVNTGLELVGKGTVEEHTSSSPITPLYYEPQHSSSSSFKSSHTAPERRRSSAVSIHLSRQSSTTDSPLLNIPNEISSSELKIKKVRQSPSEIGTEPFRRVSDTPTLISMRPGSTRSSIVSENRTKRPSLIPLRIPSTSSTIESSAQWYVTQILSNQLSVKQYRQLLITMQHGSFEFLQEFMFLQGHVALSMQLHKQSRRSIKTNDQLDLESSIALVLRNLINYKEGAESMCEHPSSIQNCTASLISAKLSTRKVISEMLMLLAYWSQTGRNNVLMGLETLARRENDLSGSGFKPWLNIIDETLDAVDYRRRTDSQVESYILQSIFLLNALLETSVSVDERLKLRSDLELCGINKVFAKMEKLKLGLLTEQIKKYKDSEREDTLQILGPAEGSQTGLKNLTSSISSLPHLISRFTENKEFVTNLSSIMSLYRQILSGVNDVAISETIRVLNLLTEQVTTSIESDSFDPSLQSAIKELVQKTSTKGVLKQQFSESSSSARLLKVLTEENEDLKSSVQGLLENEESKFESLYKELEMAKAQLRQLQNGNKPSIPESKILTEDTESYVSKLKPNAQLFRDLDKSESLIIKHGIANMKGKFTEARKVDSPLFEIPSGGSSFFQLTSPNVGSTECLNVDYKNNDTQIKLNHYSEIFQDLGTGRSSEKSVIVQNVQSGLSNGSTSSGSAETSSQNPTGLEVMSQQSAPPPVPPLPPFLQKSSEQKAVLAAPPPPPPPNLPPFLQSFNQKKAIAPAPPPPPPPLPPLLKKVEAKAVPPPAPPLPKLLQNPVKKDASKEADKESKADIKREEELKVEQEEDEKHSVTFLERIPKPNRKMKQIHWDKIETDQINGTFWTEIEEQDDIGENVIRLGILSEVETFFAVKETKIKTKSKPSSTENKKKSFLSREMAQHFGINLHLLGNLPVEEVVLTVLHCDPIVMDNIQILEFFCKDDLTEISNTVVKNFEPYSTDYTSEPYKEAKKNPNELDRHDRIFLELCFNLRGYWKSRSRSLLLIKNYLSNFHDLNRKIEMLDNAITAVKSSESLKNVLSVIRTMGNYMNNDNRKAHGFKLSTLQRLKFMKDETNSMTLLHYIEKTIRNSFPELGEFVDDLNIVVAASKISVENLMKDCEDYTKQINNAIMSLEQGNLKDPSKLHPEDKILEVVKKPLTSAQYKAAVLQRKTSQVVADLDELFDYFGESNKSDKNALFQILATFITEFKKTHLENIQKEEEIKVIENRKKIAEAKLNREKEDKENCDTAKSKDSSENNTLRNSMMESLLERLKSQAAGQRKANRSTLTAYYQTQSTESSLNDDEGEVNSLEARAARMLQELKNF